MTRRESRAMLAVRPARAPGSSAAAKPGATKISVPLRTKARMRLLRLAMEDSSALVASRSARPGASTDSFLDFISRIIARGALGRNWPAVKKMTRGKCL
jgi:hypothetical protein